MAGDEIRLLGLGEALENLKKLSRNIQNNIVRRAARAAGQVYLKDVKGQAYGGGRTQRTGLLGRSPGVTVSKKGDNIVGRVKMRPVNIGGRTKIAQRIRTARKIEAEPGRRFAAFYWRFLEFGIAKERKTRKGASRGTLTARSWVRPIFSSDATPAIEAFRKVIERGVEDEAAKLPKTYKR